MSIPSGKPAHDMNPLDRLDEIQARADKATDGPWDEYDAQIRHTQIDGFTRPNERAAAQRQTAADIDFVMHARTDVPDLVGALHAVLDLCDSTTLECRPGDGSQPYMVVPADVVKAAIEVALEEPQS